jgi:hypothetical protein
MEQQIEAQGLLDFRIKAKAKQAAKLVELREALVAAGCRTTAEQAVALGVSRPTAWALLNRDKRAGPSAVVIKRILASRNLPPAARRKVQEYIEEKIAGLYGHHPGRTRWFRDQFHIPAPAEKRNKGGGQIQWR